MVVILRPVKRNIITGTKYEGKSTSPVMPTYKKRLTAKFEAFKAVIIYRKIFINKYMFVFLKVGEI